MTQLLPIALDSYELAPYSVEVPCLVCDGGNSFDLERCRHCQAPLALTYQADGNRKTTPQMVAVLGPSGCGKTVYLGMLADMLSRHEGPLQVLARGAFSLEMQQRSVADLARRRFPPSTGREPEHWNWMHCQVKRRRRPVEFVLPDISGAAIEEEIEHQGSSVIRAFVKKCAAAVILIDAERLERGDDSPDFFAMKAVSHLHELGRSRKARWAKRPVAIVFTKADQSAGCSDDPSGFAETHAPGLWRMCRERLQLHRFFAVSVVGASAVADVEGDPTPLALRIEPRGITQPMEWLLGQWK